MDDRERLRQRFNRQFSHFEIELPVAAMSPGSVWLIVKRGWTIWTRFDIDAGDGREHLDHYSMHRMTNDSHVRWYADGEEEDLPAMGRACATPEGATDAEEEAARAKFFADNQAVEKLLGLSQPDVSRLLRGNFRDYSVERLLRLLTALGRDVQINIRKSHSSRKGTLTIGAAEVP